MEISTGRVASRPAPNHLAMSNNSCVVACVGILKKRPRVPNHIRPDPLPTERDKMTTTYYSLIGDAIQDLLEGHTSSAYVVSTVLDVE